MMDKRLGKQDGRRHLALTFSEMRDGKAYLDFFLLFPVR